MRKNTAVWQLKFITIFVATLFCFSCLYQDSSPVPLRWNPDALADIQPAVIPFSISSEAGGVLEGFSLFPVIDPAGGDSAFRVFLSGESHGTKANYSLEFGLLEYLYRNAAVRVVIA